MVYELIKLIKKTEKIKESQSDSYSFNVVQKALQDIKDDLSNDIINIEREERL
ncbi:MAG: hypothetical protein L3J74_11685 [Bacteroidales bacterium]|nr:hypothetical protein [Bacteroidales bacterium]